jgi:hypothetical protein
MMNRIRFAAEGLAMAAALAAAVAVAVSGCSQDPGPVTGRSAQPTQATGPPPTTTITPTPTPTPKTRKELATEQLLRYLNIRDNSVRVGRVNVHRLAKVSTGSRFLNVQEYLIGQRRDGVKVTGRYVHTLGEPRDFDAYILIDDCEDRGRVKRRVDGEVVRPDMTVNGTPAPNPLLYHYRLIRVDGKGPWKVSEFGLSWDKPC